MLRVNYKNLHFYQISYKFAIDIHKITNSFPKEELYKGITDQIRRASKSIGANISEGSAKSKADFARFLRISLGSARECEHWLSMSKDLCYISVGVYNEFMKTLNQIIGSLVGYIQKLRG